MLDLTYENPKPKTLAGATSDWELVIGLEVHAQVSSNAKLFSGASTQFGAEPNSNVAFVDAGMPGMLPVINEYCVEQAALPLIARTISTQICRKVIRFHSFTIQSLVKAKCWLNSARASPALCGSSVSTLNRTRVNRSTTWIQTCHSSI